MAVAAAKILEQRSHLVPGKLRITEHFFQVPRDHSRPSAGTLTLFARSAEKYDKPIDSSSDENASAASKKRLPWLLYLQGGPGFGCGPPQNAAFTRPLLDKGYRVLCLDGRGTGLSTPLTAATLGLRGDDSVQAEYLRSFRSDSIVRDCEAIRLALTAEEGENGEPPADEKRKWSILGQSFGGFCAVTYLSMFPDALREAFIFGGLPPLVDQPDEVYRRLIPRAIQRTKAYYEKFPEDVDRVKRIVGVLRRHGDRTVRMPSEGGFLSARRFLQLGIFFGGHGGVDAVHGIVLRATADLDQFGSLTRPTLAAIDAAQPWDTHIIYAILHEPIYCQGKNASNWSSDRLLKEFPEFDLDTDGPLHFTSENIFSSMLEDFGELRKISGPANQLAEHNDWPRLYDLEQLSKNTVPVYAAVYFDDAYVDFELSLKTAASIKGCQIFTTNALYHNALSTKNFEVFQGVFNLRDDVID